MDHPENDAQYAGLAVNKGIEQPPIVNPYLKKMRTAKRRSFTASEYVEGIVKGDTSILSQAVTLVESNLYEHQTLAQEVIEKCLPHACDSVRVGITGVRSAFSGVCRILGNIANSLYFIRDKNDFTPGEK